MVQYFLYYDYKKSAFLKIRKHFTITKNNKLRLFPTILPKATTTKRFYDFIKKQPAENERLPLCGLGARFGCEHSNRRD